METREFCNDLSAELAGWKAQLYEIIGLVETLPALDRQYFSPATNIMRALISEIEERVKMLKRECPADTIARPKAA